MKRNIFYLLVFVLPMWFVGCDENGDDGYYDGISRIYFGEETAHYGLGFQPVEVTTYEVTVPVCILGDPASRDMKVQVKVDEERTTATENMYNLLAEDVIIPKDSIRGYVKVLLLVENEDFKLGLEERLETEITFSNYLEEPEWWSLWETIYWGPYHPLKYQKMIEYWGGEIVYDDFYTDQTRILFVTQQAYEYFEAHPEYGMEFVEGVNWPFVIE